MIGHILLMGKELKPEDIPEPLGKSVINTCYVDTNLYHAMIKGRSVTGIIHLVNKIPIGCYSKKIRYGENSHLWFQMCCCKDYNKAGY